MRDDLTAYEVQEIYNEDEVDEFLEQLEATIASLDDRT